MSAALSTLLATSVLAAGAVPALVIVRFPTDAHPAPVEMFAVAPSELFASSTRFMAPAPPRTTSAFLSGRFGVRSWRDRPRLGSASFGEAETAWQSILLGASHAAAPAAPQCNDLDPVPTPLPIVRTIRRALAARVTFIRNDGETDSFSLTTIDGEVAPGALDHLGVALRTADTERPVVPLPDEPSVDAAPGEWVPGVRLAEPRLVWLLQVMASRFPRRPFFVTSGYRRGPHHGRHASGLAIDLSIKGVSNADVYLACRSLRDAGCGYYPNNNFVHLDVRPSGTPRVFWVDAASPGEPSRYVDGWPGVEAARASSHGEL